SSSSSSVGLLPLVGSLPWVLPTVLRDHRKLVLSKTGPGAAACQAVRESCRGLAPQLRHGSSEIGFATREVGNPAGEFFHEKLRREDEGVDLLQCADSTVDGAHFVKGIGLVHLAHRGLLPWFGLLGLPALLHFLAELADDFLVPLHD